MVYRAELTAPVVGPTMPSVSTPTPPEPSWRGLGFVFEMGVRPESTLLLAGLKVKLLAVA